MLITKSRTVSNVEDTMELSLSLVHGMVTTLIGSEVYPHRIPLNHLECKICYEDKITHVRLGSQRTIQSWLFPSNLF